MQHSFGDFLKHGGNGEYLIAQRHGRVVGHRVGLSHKSTFPNYSSLRADFAERLDQVISENTRMLLNVLTPPDTVPMVSEADLRDMSDAVSYTLDAWDVRLEAIFVEYQTHSQRLRPLRQAMEERLVRGFAGLVNQLRQEDLGIEAYIWSSQNDAKVRDNHADYDDRVFRWDSPPDSGHPGQAHNCRCWAEPLPMQNNADVILADARAADVPFESDIGLRPITPSGSAAVGLLAAAGGATLIQRLLDQPYLDRAERVLGTGTDTVEGFVGTWAYGMILRRINDGIPGDILNYPKNGDDAEILAQAAGLFAMMYPDVAIRALSRPPNPVDLARLDAFMRRSHDAYLADRIQLNGGDFADGWVETFPELTEDERRLGEVPGFTPERIEQWLETYPIEELGLPNNTGSPIPDDPNGNIISTPPEETGPNIVAIERTQEELDALAADPSHGGAMREQGIREREIGLGAEEAGLVPGPIVRDTTGAAEFIDANDQAWDVKGFRSGFPASAGGFDVTTDVAKIERELRSGHNVIIDTGFLTETDLQSLQEEVERRGISDRVVYWP